MEKDKAATDDSADYHGDIKQIKSKERKMRSSRLAKFLQVAGNLEVEE